MMSFGSSKLTQNIFKKTGASFAMCTLLFSVLSAFADSAQAIIYPKWQKPNTQVTYIQDPALDLSLRHYFYGKATKSIHVISFEQSVDAVGTELVVDLRDALKRNLEVSAVYDGVATGMVAGDGGFGEYAAQLLTDSSLPRQAEVICPSMLEKLGVGLFIDDFIHEKIVIIDLGTPQVKIFIGGRGQTKTALAFEDSTFLLQPVDPTQPWAGSDIIEYFIRARRQYRTLFSQYEKSTPSKKVLALLDRPSAVALKTKEQVEKFSKLKKLVQQDPTSVAYKDLDTLQFRPLTFQVSGNDLLQNVAREHPGYLVGSRDDVPDDNMALILSLLPDTQHLFISAYGFGPTDIVKDEFLKFVQEGKKFTIVTNSRAAFMKASPEGTFGRAFMMASSDYTVRGLLPLLEAAAKTKLQNVNVFRSSSIYAPLDLERARYLHHKYMVLDNLVVGGSNNFTASSSKKNSEVMILMEDPRLARYMREKVHKNLGTAYARLTLSQAKAEIEGRAWCSDILQGMVKQGL